MVHIVLQNFYWMYTFFRYYLVWFDGSEKATEPRSESLILSPEVVSPVGVRSVDSKGLKKRVWQVDVITAEITMALLTYKEPLGKESRKSEMMTVEESQRIDIPLIMILRDVYIHQNISKLMKKWKIRSNKTSYSF
jgi:hypothetical protein